MKLIEQQAKWHRSQHAVADGELLEYSSYMRVSHAGSVVPETVSRRALRHGRRFALVLLMLAFIGVAHAGGCSQGGGLRVTLLGTGSPIPSPVQFGPATLVEAGSEKLLFDVGRGASIRIVQTGNSLGSVTDVFISHFHADHTVGLPDLMLTGWYGLPFGQRRAKLDVHGPKGIVEMAAALEQAFKIHYELRMAMSVSSSDGGRIRPFVITKGAVFDRNGLKVFAFPVEHVNPRTGYRIETYGFRVEYQGKTVVISSDTRPTHRVVEQAKGADLLLHELIVADATLYEASPAVRGIVSGHTSPSEAARIFRDAKPKMAAFTHVIRLGQNPPTDDEILADVHAIYDGRVTIGADMTTFCIGNTIKIGKGTENCE